MPMDTDNEEIRQSLDHKNNDMVSKKYQKIKMRDILVVTTRNGRELIEVK